MDYVLFGIQGSGKGTQGKILADKIAAVYFETGGELRRLSTQDSALGRKVKSIIEAGRLVPNEVVMEIVENFVQSEIKSLSSSVIFDGIPRNDLQSRTFRALLEKLHRDYTGVYFELLRQEAENRLLRRRICEKCKTVYPASCQEEKCKKCAGKLVSRADDNAQSIRMRLDIFYKETLPVIETWRDAGKLISLDGTGTIEVVTSELFLKLGLK